MPEPDYSTDRVELYRIRELFHGLIRSRAREGQLPMPRKLPTLRDLGVDAEPEWFPVDGMYGGFSYRLVRLSTGLQLKVESWSRIADGSGMRHRITSTEVVLEEEGFV